MLALATFDDAELDSLASLQAGHAGRQRVGADLDIAALILGQEAEALFGVVKPHFANRHVQTSLAFAGSRTADYPHHSALSVAVSLSPPNIEISARWQS